jgi:hypothetical protein
MRVAIAISLDVDGQNPATLSTSLGGVAPGTPDFVFFPEPNAPA